MKRIFQQPAKLIAKPIAVLLAAFALVAAVVIALGASPLNVFAALLNGAAGSWLKFADTLVKATPLVFTGLAVAIAFQAALWNIGAEGQLLAGALTAAALGTHLLGWPRLLAVAIVLASGALAGAAWGGVSGWLKAKRGVNEVISTIMLNFIALEMVSWAVHGPLMEASRAYPESGPIAPSAELYALSLSRLNAGMVLAVALAVICYVLVFHSEAGFKLRAFGKNRRASAFFGIATARLTIGAMAVSGAMAGLAGAVQLSAVTHRLYERFSPGWGYEAIAVALVARLNPLGVLPAALFFGALDNGAQAMQRSQNISPVLVQVIQAMVIFILLAVDTPVVGAMWESLAHTSQAPAAGSSAPRAASDA